MLIEFSGPAVQLPHDEGSSSPTARQITALALPDLLAPNLDLVFVGINPSLKSARVGHYYAGLGNLY
jgi:hypothetical protein